MASGNALIFRWGILRDRWVAEISIGPGRTASYIPVCLVYSTGVEGKMRACSH